MRGPFADIFNSQAAYDPASNIIVKMYRSLHETSMFCAEMALGIVTSDLVIY